MDESVEKETKKDEDIKPVLSSKNKEGSFKPLIFIMIFSFALLFAWDKFPFIKNSVHAVLNPTAGWLLNLNLTLGMIIIVFVVTLITTIIQKYATDQKTLKELKKEQKILSEEMKKYRDNPEKVAELSKKQFEFIPRTMKLTSRSLMFTGIPFILTFRWFNDYFSAPELVDFRFFGFLSWILFYLIFNIIVASVLRKIFKVV